MPQTYLPFFNKEIPDKPFRPIHYLGSKLRLLEFIKEAVDYVDPTNGQICDLFAGSGTVSYLFSKYRSVSAVDIQEYSRVLCDALLINRTISISEVDVNALENSDHAKSIRRVFEPLIAFEELCIAQASSGKMEALCNLLELGSISANLSGPNPASDSRSAMVREVESRYSQIFGNNRRPGLITLLYGGTYFSFKQAADLDVILYQIHGLKPHFKDKCLAALLSTASDIVNTIGKHFAQPIRPRDKQGQPKKNLFEIVNRDRKKDVFELYQAWLDKYLSIKPKYKNQVYRMDYSEALETMRDDFKVIYADPPYTRDHYSRFYHVLETIALADDPSIAMSKTNGHVSAGRGIYRADRHQSPFCIKSQVVGAFETLFAKSKGFMCPLVLSYSPFDPNRRVRPRLLTTEQLLQIAKKYYRDVELRTIGSFSHSKLNKRSLKLEASKTAEILIVCSG